MTLDILYVDDEPDLREIASMALELDPEITVRTASGGAAALEILSGWTPDVILLDMMMPGMDGPAAHDAIRALPGGGPPVIYITARTQEAEIAHLLSLGAVGVIAKPFDPMSLADQVRDLADRV